MIKKISTQLKVAFLLLFVITACTKEKTKTTQVSQNELLNPNSVSIAEAKTEFTNAVQGGLTVNLKSRSSALFPDWRHARGYHLSEEKDALYVTLTANSNRHQLIQLIVRKDGGRVSSLISETISEDQNTRQNPSDYRQFNGYVIYYSSTGKFRQQILLRKGYLQSAETLKKSLSTTRLKTMGFGDDNGDEDGDGVPNSLDLCPNTPVDVMVDPNGCPITVDLDPVVITPPPDTDPPFIWPVTDYPPYWGVEDPTGAGGGPGGGDGSGPVSPQDIGLEYPPNTNNSPIDPKKETKCFDKTQSATMTVYVQQPDPNTRNLNGANGIGHTFIGITQGGVTRTFGFYPTSALAAVFTSTDSKLMDNYNYTYNVSVTKDVTAGQLTNMINYINNYPQSYNLQTYNCTDFAIAVAAQGGLTLPATLVQTSLAGLPFSAHNPGDLGQDLRNATLPSGVTRSTNTGTSPSKSGTCSN